ncbi:MAG: hypothetical protein HPZ91_19235 [Lentisphaeria bacterium]|nr:hypothetical protein [Lentisphaeria bacterium]
MTQKNGKTMTGELRRDIELIPPGEHGDYPMLFDPVSDHYYKLDARTGAILALMDRSYELGEFSARLKAAGIDAGQAELYGIVSFLHSNNLLLPEYGSVEQRSRQLREAKAKTLWERLAGSYLFFKLPPVHPDKFFTRSMPFVRMLFNPVARYALLAASVLGYILILREFTDVGRAFVDSLSWVGLVNYFWALLVAKALHELAHAYAAKNYGCRVRAMGVSFIVFYPRLFTDLSDSWRLSRRKRLTIDLAGIAAELIFGGIAALCWVYAAPGPFRSTMFYLFTVSAAGTLLVNANPFIRYDGYYILCDLLNTDNLMQRSAEYVKGFNRKLFLGLGRVPETHGTPGALLYLFGVGSFAYRLFLSFSIILIIYFQFAKPVALALVCLSCYSMIWMPFYREYRFLSGVRRKMDLRKAALLAGGAAALLAVFLIPLPWSLTMPAELAPRSRMLVTVAESGFAETELPSDPRSVAPGDRLLALSNVFQEFNLHRYRLITEYGRTELEILRSSADTLGFGPQAHKKLQSDRLTLEEITRRRGNLTIRAEAAGVFVPRLAELSPGRWLDKGTALGEIISPECVVHGYVTEDGYRDIRPGDEVEFQLSGELGAVPCRIESLNPVPATFRESALIQQYGGTVPCYPPVPPSAEFKPVATLYRVTARPLTETPLIPGRTGRIRVRKSYSLAGELRRTVLHAFLREFSF